MVLLALERTHSPAAAGLIVSAYTLPALVSGPLLGAWLDRTAHRKLALVANQLALAACMVGLVLTLGHAPLAWCLAIVAAAGVTLPLTSAGVAAVLVGVAGLVSGPLLVATFSMRQRYTPPNLLAQVSTAGASLKIGAYSLGAAAGGWLVPSVGALAAIGVVAALHVVGAIAGHLAGRSDPGVLKSTVDAPHGTPQEG